MTRQEAIGVIKDFVAYGKHVNAFVYKGSTSIPIEALNMAIKALEQEPKRGMWIVYPLMDEGLVELECPICGDTFIRAVNHKPHFCENCGARMESAELDCELLREVCHILKELKESEEE